MERNFYNDEFEQLIREKTDQYKMYPSENVWKGIHGSLHTRRRWFIGAMSFLIGGIILFAGKELILQGNRNTSLRKIAANTLSPAKSSEEKIEDKAEDKPEEKEKHLSAALSDFKTGSSRSQRNGGRTARTGDKFFAGENSFEEASTDAADDGSSAYEVTDVRQAFQSPANEQAGLQTGLPASLPANEQTGGLQPITQTGIAARSQNTSSTRSHGGGHNNTRNEDDNDADMRAKAKDIAAATGSSENALASGKTFEKKHNHAGAASAYLFSGIYSSFGPGINDDLSSDQVLAGLGLPHLPHATVHLLAFSINKKLTDRGLPLIPSAPAIDVVETGRNEENWLEEYAVNELIPTPKRINRLSLQLYLTPGLNYRNLSLGNNYNTKTNTQNLATTPAQNPNARPGDLFNQKPSPGFDAGAAILYRVNRILTLKAGMQFSYIRYNLTPAVNSFQPASNTGISTGFSYPGDSTNQNAPVHNPSGKATAGLTNQYYQLSAPVGLELRILGGERLQLNVAATIEPTYLFNTNSYVPSADNTGYIKNPSLFRRWNWNGTVEAFLSYKIGGLRWQLGPELRYQMLSTYNSQYPLHENFRQYGLKIGVSKTIW